LLRVRGKIINVASIGADISFQHVGLLREQGGVKQLTKVMALEWVRYNIQVNAIQPGYFETPINTKFFASKS